MTRALAWLRRHGSIIYLTALAMVIPSGSYALALWAVHRATAASASIVQVCESGNHVRAQQVALWEFVVRISRPPPHETAAHRQLREATVRRFIAHLHQVFAPRDCQKGFTP